LKVEKKEKKNDTTIKKCPRCDKMNPTAGRFCLRCGTPLDSKTAMETEEKRKEMDNVMAVLLKDLLNDPEIQARIEKKLEQVGLKASL
jgi:predicted amidophosphoribosyltransferase